MIPAHKGTRVFCDANVLYGSLLRNFLMWLGVEGTLNLRWSQRVYEEWSRNLLLQRPDLSPESVARTFAQMNLAMPEALVEEDSGEDLPDLPDPDDEHVLATALACEAEVLLTFNLKDFPQSAVPAELQVVHPDHFLRVCLDRQPQAVLQGLHDLRTNLKRPPLTSEEILEGLGKAGVPEFAQVVRQKGWSF